MTASGRVGSTLLGLQRRLALGLAREVVHREGVGDARIHARVVLLRVDAVQDAVQLPGALLEDVLETLAVEGHLELLGVRGAHRGDRVGVEQRALHEVDGLGAHVHLAGGRRVGKPADVAQDIVSVLALELDVGDGEDRLDVVVAGKPAVELAQEHAGKRRLPVVAVQHVDTRELGDAPDDLGDGLREEREALAVVEVAVDAVAAEVVLVVHEVVVDVVVAEVVDAAPDVAPAQVHVEVAHVAHGVAVLGLDPLVLGQHDGHLAAAALELVRKRARNVTQAARLHERGGLGGAEDHAKLPAGSATHYLSPPFSFTRTVSGVPRSSVPAVMTFPRSMIACSRRAPRLMTQSFMMTQSRTEAPGSMTT